MRIEADVPRRRAIGLTPLIDVVFLLLLFFMLASSFARHSAIQVAIAGEGPAAEAQTQRILISVQPSGRYLVNGVETAHGEIADEVRRLAGEASVQLLVRPVGAATVQDIVSALEAASGAGVGDVVLVR